MKKYCTGILALVFFITFTLQGCGGLPNKYYVKKDASEATPLKVVHYETSTVREYSTGGLVTTLIVTGVLLGGIGAGLGAMIYYGGTKEPYYADVPDFSKLVMNRFVERARQEIPNWPSMAVVDVPAKDTVKDKTCYILEFKADDISIEKNSGLSIRTIATLKDRDDNVVWEKGYDYISFDFQRANSLENLKADNCKLLKEELPFAADKTVSDFIQHFKSPQPPPVKQI
jgi:hypothetical protein